MITQDGCPGNNNFLDNESFQHNKQCFYHLIHRFSDTIFFIDTPLFSFKLVKNHARDAQLCGSGFPLQGRKEERPWGRGCHKSRWVDVRSLCRLS